MGSFSIWHWVVVFLVVMLLFGRGRFSEMMGDVAKGIKSFKKGMAEDEEAPRQIGREQQARLERDAETPDVARRATASEAEPDRDRRA